MLFVSFAVFAALILIPSGAVAWGPATHVHFALCTLSDASVIAEAFRTVLLSNPLDFIYGVISPDAVIGKNAAPAYRHGHRWQVGFRMLESAYDDSQAAYALGYLHHLAADAVSHNLYVPYMIVKWPGKKGSKHIYWENRFEQRITASRPDIDPMIKSVMKLRPVSHDRFFRLHVPPAVLPHRFSNTVFRGGVVLQRQNIWRNRETRIAEKSPFTLSGMEFEAWERRTIRAAHDLMTNLDKSGICEVDPTGRDAISSASYCRRRVRSRRIIRAA